MIQKERMIEEATTRLEVLQANGLWDEVVRVWKEDNEACVALKIGGAGINFAFCEKPELKEIKEKFEKEYDSLVYHGIYTETVFGDLLSLFYVSNTETSWRREKSGMKKGRAFVYVWNMTTCSGEFGPIEYDLKEGGLVRVG